MTDLEAVSGWVERYLRAWGSNDPAQIGALFAEDAAYYPAPHAEPWRGRDEIVAAWLEHRDKAGEWEFTWFPVTVSPDLSIVQGVTQYADAAGSGPRRYSNLWLLRLDAVGQCRQFTEWWMEQD